MVVVRQWFSNCIIYFMFTSWYPTVRQHFLSFPSFSSQQQPHRFLFYSLAYNPLLLFSTLMLRLTQIWPSGAISSWLLCPFDMSTSFLEHFLTFWHNTFRIILNFPCPSPGISNFSSKSWFLLVENGFQKPRSECQMCPLLLRHLDYQAFSMDVVMKLNICMYSSTHGCTHTEVCTYMQVCTLTFICSIHPVSYKSRDVSDYSQITWFILAFQASPGHTSPTIRLSHGSIICNIYLSFPLYVTNFPTHRPSRPWYIPQPQEDSLLVPVPQWWADSFQPVPVSSTYAFESMLLL